MVAQKKQRFQVIRTASLLFITLFLAGCVHLDEYIQINRNGSAKIVISYSIPLSSLSLLKDSEAVIGELQGVKNVADMPRLFDAKLLRQHFEKYKGVDIISIRVKKEDGRITTFLSLFVDDFRGVLRDGMLPYTTLEKAGEDYVFAARYPFNLSKLKPDKALEKAFSEMRVNFKVKTPTEITKTNANSQLANLAVWEFSKKNPFLKTNGRLIVQFKGNNLSFLDKPSEKSGKE